MLSNSNKSDLVQYCRQKNIRKYSSLNRDDLIRHIIKSVYFRALLNYGNKRAYEELNSTYRSKTEEYKGKIKYLEEKIINIDHEETMNRISGCKIEEMNVNNVNKEIKHTLSKIHELKQLNKVKEYAEWSRELVPFSIELRKLKYRYEELTGFKWKPMNNLEITSRINGVELKMFIEKIKQEYSTDKIEFDEIVNKRYDNLYEDFKRYSLEIDSTFPLKENLLFHGTDETNISSILENDFALINKPVHGTAYGPGIYFTNKLNLACRYSHDSKIKYILVCNVHIGNITQGSIKKHSLENGFHTAVDNTSNPSQFIKKKNNQYTFIGLLKIHVSKNSKLFQNYSQYNAVLRVNNNNFSKDIQILFLKGGRSSIPLHVDYIQYTKDLLTKEMDDKGTSNTNIHTNFIKLNPANQKSFSCINCNIDNIYVLGYYDEGIDDINSKVTKEFIILRINKIKKKHKIINL
jgi:hypothetical protein